MIIRNILTGVCCLILSMMSANAALQDDAENSKNILIAYFTWADNTHVADPSQVDLDATTSASLLIPGNTAKLAQWIHEEAGGDIFSITVKEPYSSDYDECLERAASEKDNDIYPELTSRVNNLENYDTVFLGFPNWWYSCPMAILTFIKENNLSGKTIIPFASHGTGGFAASLRDIKEALPDNCVMLKEFGVYRSDVDRSRPALVSWLHSLNLK